MMLIIKVQDGLARNKIMTILVGIIIIIIPMAQEVRHMGHIMGAVLLRHHLPMVPIVGAMDQLLPEAAVVVVAHIIVAMDHHPLPAPTEHHPPLLPMEEHHLQLPHHHITVEAPIRAHGVREAHPPTLINGVVVVVAAAILTTIFEEEKEEDYILSKLIYSRQYSFYFSFPLQECY
jgi:hypothetical protein